MCSRGRISSSKIYYGIWVPCPLAKMSFPRSRDRRGGVLDRGRDGGNEDIGSAWPPKMAAGRLLSFSPCRGEVVDRIQQEWG